MNLLSKLGLWNEPVEEETTNQNLQEDKQETKQKSFVSENNSETKKATISFAPTVVANLDQIVGKVDKEIFEKLSLAIEENNLDGNDFLEFMQSLNNLQNLTIDEKTKFNMVFTTLSTSSGGMNKEVLIKSIFHYLKVLENEKNVFGDEMTKATEEMVVEKENYIESLTQTVNQKNELIQKLTQEIQETNSEIVSVKTEVNQSKNTISQKQADFATTSQQLENQINGLKTKIEQYI